ncbi:MAG: copper resistance protein CopD [Ignavibacteria bacterium GWB2_35_12]|nr:MAG: copper resistance protein CopD [Ignavibacteria bacterium GWB2_35_12]OGV22015.1 MAG: copper resistance protein CopD [Ignavibacteria bacterium RIFOXYC2_FULL_35_21]
MHKYILMLHVISATVWAGGHLILSLTVLPRVLKTKNVSELLHFESGFEKVGIPSLIIQVITGIWLAYDFVPDVESWFLPHDHMSHLVTIKLFLLLTTIGLAIHARFKIIPNLNENNLKKLSYHIIPVTIIAVLFVIVGVSFRTGGLF